jgi:hypothetical protein
MTNAVVRYQVRQGSLLVGTSRTRAAADKRASGFTNGKALQPRTGPRRIYRTVIALRVLNTPEGT